MSRGVQMNSSGVQSNYQESEIPQICTQGGLEINNLGEEVVSTPVVNTSKIRFQPKEDEVIIQSWLNVSKDPIVGIDQKGESFWKRIGDAYNTHRDKKYIERKSTTLKGRWHNINAAMQKFVGCYKQIVATQKSGSSESDIILAVKQIFHQDEHEKFTFKDAWRLMKDEPKWLAGLPESSAKRTKNSLSGAYSSSSNPVTPTSSEYNPESPTSLCQSVKRLPKERRKKSLWKCLLRMSKLMICNMVFKKKYEPMSEFARNYERLEGEKVEIERKMADVEVQRTVNEKDRLKINDLEILAKDTSYMNHRQLQAHEMLCDVIREKYGLN